MHFLVETKMEQDKITQKDIENIKYLSQQYQKSIEEKPQPQFTLTAEEVEIVQNLVAQGYLDMQYLIKMYKDDRLYVKIMKDKSIMLDNLLTRIKKWQSEKQ